MSILLSNHLFKEFETITCDSKLQKVGLVGVGIKISSNSCSFMSKKLLCCYLNFFLDTHYCMNMQLKILHVFQNDSS